MPENALEIFVTLTFVNVVFTVADIIVLGFLHKYRDKLNLKDGEKK